MRYPVFQNPFSPLISRLTLVGDKIEVLSLSLAPYFLCDLGGANPELVHLSLKQK